MVSLSSIQLIDFCHRGSMRTPREPSDVQLRQRHGWSPDVTTGASKPSMGLKSTPNGWSVPAKCKETLVCIQVMVGQTCGLLPAQTTCIPSPTRSLLQHLLNPHEESWLAPPNPHNSSSALYSLPPSLFCTTLSFIGCCKSARDVSLLTRWGGIRHKCGRTSNQSWTQVAVKVKGSLATPIRGCPSLTVCVRGSRYGRVCR